MGSQISLDQERKTHNTLKDVMMKKHEAKDLNELYQHHIASSPGFRDFVFSAGIPDKMEGLPQVSTQNDSPLIPVDDMTGKNVGRSIQKVQSSGQYESSWHEALESVSDGSSLDIIVDDFRISIDHNSNHSKPSPEIKRSCVRRLDFDNSSYDQMEVDDTPPENSENEVQKWMGEGFKKYQEKVSHESPPDSNDSWHFLSQLRDDQSFDGSDQDLHGPSSPVSKKLTKSIIKCCGEPILCDENCSICRSNPKIVCIPRASLGIKNFNSSIQCEACGTFFGAFLNDYRDESKIVHPNFFRHVILECKKWRDKDQFRECDRCWSRFINDEHFDGHLSYCSEIALDNSENYDLKFLRKKLEMESPVVDSKRDEDRREKKSSSEPQPEVRRSPRIMKIMERSLSLSSLGSVKTRLFTSPIKCIVCSERLDTDASTNGKNPGDQNKSPVRKQEVKIELMDHDPESSASGFKKNLTKSDENNQVGIDYPDGWHPAIVYDGLMECSGCHKEFPAATIFTKDDGKKMIPCLEYLKHSLDECPEYLMLGYIKFCTRCNRFFLNQNDIDAHRINGKCIKRKPWGLSPVKNTIWNTDPEELKNLDVGLNSSADHKLVEVEDQRTGDRKCPICNTKNAGGVRRHLLLVHMNISEKYLERTLHRFSLKDKNCPLCNRTQPSFSRLVHHVHKRCRKRSSYPQDLFDKNKSDVSESIKLFS